MLLYDEVTAKNGYLLKPGRDAQRTKLPRGDLMRRCPTTLQCVPWCRVFHCLTPISKQKRFLIQEFCLPHASKNTIHFSQACTHHSSYYRTVINERTCCRSLTQTGKTKPFSTFQVSFQEHRVFVQTRKHLRRSLSP